MATETQSAAQGSADDPATVPTYGRLRSLSTEELVRRHDALVAAEPRRRADADLYRDELRLRMEELRTERLARLLAGMIMMSFATLVVACIALVLVAS